MESGSVWVWKADERRDLYMIVAASEHGDDQHNRFTFLHLLNGEVYVSVYGDLSLVADRLT